MLERVRRWYDGTPKLREYENEPNSMLVFMPTPYVERHWTAQVAHVVADFCRRHWHFVVGTVLALVGIWLAL